MDHQFKPKYPEHIRMAVAKDYHFSGLMIKEICTKYNVPYGSVRSFAKAYPKEYFLQQDYLNQVDDRLIMISNDDYKNVLKIFKDLGIGYTVPNSYNIELRFESSINN